MYHNNNNNHNEWSSNKCPGSDLELCQCKELVIFHYDIFVVIKIIIKCVITMNRAQVSAQALTWSYANVRSWSSFINMIVIKAITMNSQQNTPCRNYKISWQSSSQRPGSDMELRKCKNHHHYHHHHHQHMCYNNILNLKSANLANLSDEKVLHALHTQKRV